MSRKLTAVCKFYNSVNITSVPDFYGSQNLHLADETHCTVIICYTKNNIYPKIVNN